MILLELFRSTERGVGGGLVNKYYKILFLITSINYLTYSINNATKKDMHSIP